MKNVRFLFWFIIVLTVAAILIDIPKTIPLSIYTPKLPIVNREISFSKTLSGFNPNFFIGPIHVQNKFEFERGLDLAGGVSLTYKADTKGASPDQKAQAVESAKTVIENRINQ